MFALDAVILVDHGSRAAEAAAELAAFADAAALRLGVPVYPAHMELAEPTIAQALAQAADDGARRLAVCPMFLSAGRHARRDVPARVQRAAEAHPELTVRVTDPLGLDEALIDVIARRLARCVEREPA